MKVAASILLATAFSSRLAGVGNTGARSATAGRAYADRAGENPESKRLKDLREALNQLKATMNPKEMAKKAAAEKIGMLQRRLMELKQMLLHASPEQAKALARELKSIAGELASAAKAAGAASSDGQAMPVFSPAASDVQGAASASAPSDAEAAVSAEAAERAEVEAEAAAGAAAGADGAEPAQAPGQLQENKDGASGEKRSNSVSSIEIPDKVLKDMLKEARKLLKEAIDMVKSRMGHGDKESRQDVEDAEKKLREISLNTETQVTSASLYTSQGVDAPAGGGVDGSAAPGLNVSVEA